MSQIAEKDIVVYRKKLYRVVQAMDDTYVWVRGPHPKNNRSLKMLKDLKLLIPWALIATWGLEPEEPFPFKVGDVVYEDPKYPNVYGPTGVGAEALTIKKIDSDKSIICGSCRFFALNLTKEKPPTTPAES